MSTAPAREKGFTLIELLVVIVIITIIAAIAVPTFLSQRGQAVDTTMRRDVLSLAALYEQWGSDPNISCLWGTDTIPGGFAWTDSEGNPIGDQYLSRVSCYPREAVLGYASANDVPTGVEPLDTVFLSPGNSLTFEVATWIGNDAIVAQGTDLVKYCIRVGRYPGATPGTFPAALYWSDKGGLQRGVYNCPLSPASLDADTSAPSK